MVVTRDGNAACRALHVGYRTVEWGSSPTWSPEALDLKVGRKAVGGVCWCVPVCGCDCGVVFG